MSLRLYSLPYIFQKSVIQEILPSNSPSEIQGYTFMYRFDPSNYSLQNIEIGKELSDTLGGDYVGGINQNIKEVIKKLYHTYEDELTQYDNKIRELLGLGNNNPNGRKRYGQAYPWQVVYEWLWKVKYLRWQQDYLWESWKQVAQHNSQWIQFNPSECGTMGIVIPEPASQETIPINTPLNLKIELDCLGSYLYLFNRGVDTRGNITKYLIAPSQAFAPNCQLLDEVIIMPQKGAMCEDIEFDAVGREEYLGIVVDKPLPLSSFNPDPSNPALEWQGNHLGQVWEQLQDKNWRVFYKEFEVVSSEDLAA
ncbi:hypothetical protein Sta7437_4823 (plasmid) [Stanieria cyanosphaera PCC 7437]|uniref:DUF4384 domain-containing protein n=1 Tax=Stanieria cyanosphaera (strain ATCC 29371 / PCC 7437) TaxID=111780 RepID=K9Y2L0_STAC7|nr:hypothetical protein [Stanieria cyanosphaera]AFZ38257.1 hypothetical protein Sta7437_4823 [Stanieria cyanosphaera PCC 7437]